MNYELKLAQMKDVDIIVKYKLHSILDYASDLKEDEKNKIINFVNINVPKQLDKYKLIIVDEKMIGCLLIDKNEDGILLDEIYIESDYQHKGLGSTIIKDVLSKYKEVYLWVYKENVNAINLYKKLGFKIVLETETRYYMKYN